MLWLAGMPTTKAMNLRPTVKMRIAANFLVDRPLRALMPKTNSFRFLRHITIHRPWGPVRRYDRSRISLSYLHG